MIKTLAEIVQALDTDKQQSGYIEKYERHMDHLRDMPVKILELGVFNGGSLLMWQEYFQKGLIVGIDLAANPLTHMPERIRFYQGAQEDAVFLDRVAQECAPEGFDIIIDDASHIGTLAQASFRNLFANHLKPNGIYAIEDWGTGYWDSWPDGSSYHTALERTADWSKEITASLKRPAESPGMSPPLISPHRVIDPSFAVHNFGMVGFIKELVDEVAWPDIIHASRGNPDLPRRPSAIREMTLYSGLALIIRA